MLVESKVVKLIVEVNIYLMIFFIANRIEQI